MVEALRHAGARPVAELGRHLQNEKRAWSERFANACAVAIAAQLRETELRSKTIRPLSLADGTEPLTPLGSGASKRIDVTVTDPVLGLEVGVSLKGLNFRDVASRNYDKNLTGRLYELGDEVRMVHEHLPHAFMVGVVFLPLPSVEDKTEVAPSSFAHAVFKLRERTGRLDANLAGHASRCDAGFVALYAEGDEPQDVSRGASLFFDVTNPPPRRGRPKVESCLPLAGLANTIVARATYRTRIDYADPEIS